MIPPGSNIDITSGSFNTQEAPQVHASVANIPGTPLYDIVNRVLFSFLVQQNEAECLFPHTMRFV